MHQHGLAVHVELGEVVVVQRLADVDELKVDAIRWCRRAPPRQTRRAFVPMHDGLLHWLDDIKTCAARFPRERDAHARELTRAVELELVERVCQTRLIERRPHVVERSMEARRAWSAKVAGELCDVPLRSFTRELARQLVQVHSDHVAARVGRHALIQLRSRPSGYGARATKDPFRWWCGQAASESRQRPCTRRRRCPWSRIHPRCETCRC